MIINNSIFHINKTDKVNTSYYSKGGDSMKRLAKRAVATVAVIALMAPLVALGQVGSQQDDTIASSFGLGSNTDIRTSIINIVQYILGFLGLIAVLIVLYGGFQWMTAAGNEERVTSARATLTAGLIGLVIILAAYALAQFVIDQVNKNVTGLVP